MIERSVLRRLTWSVLAAAVVFALLAGATAFRAFPAPWAEVPFFFPSVAALDDQGRAYVSDTATRRIVALDADGTLRWIKLGGVREQGFYYAQGLAVDGAGRLYVLNWVPLPGAEYKAQEIQIQRYSADGAFDRIVYRRENRSGLDSFPGPFRFFVQGNSLFSLSTEGKTLSLVRATLDGESPTLVRSVPLAADFVALAATPDGSIAGASRDGTLWEAAPQRGWAVLSWPGLVKPWDVRYLSDGRLVVLDLRTGRLVRRDPGTLTTLLESAKTGGVFADFVAASSSAVAVADKAGQRLLISTKPGEAKVYRGAARSVLDQGLGWAFWVSLALAFVCALGGGLLSYWVLFDRRLPLLLIQLVVFVPVIVLVQALAIHQVFSVLSDRNRTEVRATLLNAAHLSSGLLPVDSIQALRSPADFGSPAYEKLKASAKVLQESGVAADAFQYLAIYRLIAGQPYYVFTGSGTFGVEYPYTLLPPRALRLFAVSGEWDAEYSDDYGVYDAAFSSILDASGQPVALLEVGRFADLIQETERAYLEAAIRVAVVSGALFVLLFVIITLLLHRSLRVLRRMTHEIASGGLSISKPLLNRDESGQLSRDFEAMSGRLRGYLEDITSLTAASARFVPRDFIDLLGVEDLTQLRLGDQTSRDMTVMFSSVLNFRKITGQMSPQGLFQYLNSYLGLTVPQIRENRGVIDKYIGETYMALFPQSPSDAIEAWRQVQRRISAYNKRREKAGSEGLQVSFGLHRGPLMLGIVGEEERLEGTVIADAVNLTSRLNGLCRHYGVPCIVTHSTLAAIDAGSVPAFRLLDHVVVKGKNEPLLVAQPLDADDPATVPLLTRLSLYQEAFAHEEAGRIAEAQPRWEELEYRLPDDAVVRRHADRCRALSKTGLPDGWTPAVKVTVK